MEPGLLLRRPAAERRIAIEPSDAAMLTLVSPLGYVGSSSPGWQRGSAGVLSFDESFRSFQFDWGGPKPLVSSPGALANATRTPHMTSGQDTQFGQYDALELAFPGAGSLVVKFFSNLDAFVFERWPLGPGTLPSTWPSFSLVGTNSSNATRCMTWGERYFFPGSVLPREARTNPQPMDLRQCDGGGGPLFLFDSAPSTPGSAPSLALSALSHFTSQSVVNCPRQKGPAAWESCALGVSAAVGCGGKGHCERFNTSALLLARPGLTRATRAYGSLLRQRHGTKRARGRAVTQLSCIRCGGSNRDPEPNPNPNPNPDPDSNHNPSSRVSPRHLPSARPSTRSMHQPPQAERFMRTFSQAERFMRTSSHALRPTHPSFRGCVLRVADWNDNQAGYSWWTAGPDQSVHANPSVTARASPLC
jgi:hypothetical protein